jgi:hypothetical protein
VSGPSPLSVIKTPAADRERHCGVFDRQHGTARTCGEDGFFARVKVLFGVNRDRTIGVENESPDEQFARSPE